MFFNQLYRYNNLVKKILVFFLVLAIVKVFFIPPFEGPDEQGHFAMVAFIAENGHAPKGEELDLSLELEQVEKILGTYRDNFGNNKFTYHPEFRTDYLAAYEAIKKLNTHQNRQTYVGKEAARYPPLYYVYSALFYKLVYPFDIFIRLYAVRIGSVFLYLGIILFAYIAFRSKTIACLTALQPMVGFVGATVNSDNLHNLLFTIFTVLTVKFINSGWKGKIILPMALILILDYFTKPQAYIMLAITFFLFIFHFRWQLFFLFPLGILAYIQGSKHLDFGKPINHNADFWEFLKFSINKLYAQNIIWYWGVFKWLGVVLPKWTWWITNRLVIVATLGLLLKIRNKLTFFFIGANIIYIAAIFYFDWRYFQIHGFSMGIQGRYYLPLIASQMWLLYTGISNLITVRFANVLLLLLFLAMQIAFFITIYQIYYA